MRNNIQFLYQRLISKLWFRPLIFCLISIAAALLAQLSDRFFSSELVPKIEKESLEDLLTMISSTMLVISIFAVGSMLSAYSAASNSATPRSLHLVISDDGSQNALSVYIGSFIFSIVATVALQNGYYGKTGFFALFVLTLLVFALVILTFLNWVDQISKLGRVQYTIKVVENATLKALSDRLEQPFLGCMPAINRLETGLPIYSRKIGYLQFIRFANLQELAEELNIIIDIHCVPGTFVSLDRPLAYLSVEASSLAAERFSDLVEAFQIEHTRSFVNDPRFGMITLSEIASRALSPAVNDPGTAIAVLGSHVRLFSHWIEKGNSIPIKKELYSRIYMPSLDLKDVFEDAFRPIARDGCANIEVMMRLQKALIALSKIGGEEVKNIALHQARTSLKRAEKAMDSAEDLQELRTLSESSW